MREAKAKFRKFICRKAFLGYQGNNQVPCIVGLTDILTIKITLKRDSMLSRLISKGVMARNEYNWQDLRYVPTYVQSVVIYDAISLLPCIR